MSLSAIKAELYAPDLPWNCYKPDDLGRVVMKFVDDHEPYFRWWSQVWYENFQFLFGNHNIRWSRRYGFAVDYDFLRQQTNNMQIKSKTNIARVVVEALASMIYSNLPEWEVEAMDESSIKGKRFRKILQKLLDCYMIRLSMDKEFQAAAISYVLFGQMAFKTDWNYSGGKMLEIPRWRKVRAPVYSTYMAPNVFTQGLIEVPTPMHVDGGQPMTEDRWEAVVDEMGRQIVQKIMAGDASVRTLTPLQYRREVGSEGSHKSRWWQEFRLLDYDQFIDEYKNVPGATKAFREIKPIYSNQHVYEFAVRHFMRMQFTTPPTVEDSFRRASSVFKSSLFKYKVLVVDHLDCPHNEKWPNGRRVVVCNGEATHITRPSYNVEGTMDGWHPYSEAQWMTVPPSSIAPGPMNDVTSKNRELNVKDSLTATAVRRNMGSQLLVKTGSGIDIHKLTGEPGVAHEVSDPFGARYLHDDMPIPPVIAQLRQQDKDDVYDVSGAGEALRGQPSTGSSSGYQEKQREEREEKRLAPARKNFEGAVSNCGQKLAVCIKQNVMKMDDLVMGYLKRAAAGEFTSQDVVGFISTPWTFGTDVKVKKSSMAIKSRASMQATYAELGAGPAAMRLGQDAKVLDRYLKLFDAEQLRDSSAAQRDRAERENEAWLDLMRLGPDAEGIPFPKVLFGDNDDIHIGEHDEFEAKYADELMNNEWLMTKFIEHKERHRLQKQEKMAELMPGTSLQTGEMMSAARQVPQPTVQTIYQKSIMDQQIKQQQGGSPQGAPQQPKGNPGAAPQGQRQAPQAPKLPGGRTNPQAPSGNTPPATSRGGLQ